MPPSTYTDYTTVLTVRFSCDADIPLADTAVRLLNADEQTRYKQSVKLMLCTSSAYATFGSLWGNDTLQEPFFFFQTETVDEEEEPFQNIFPDITEDAPYYGAIAYVSQNGLFRGEGDGKFNPDGSMTRATFATVLCRLAGDEEAVKTAGAPTQELFNDVPLGEWYAPYVHWAAENGIFKGIGDGKFNPTGEITHEQMYLVIQRFIADHGYDATDGKDTDISSLADANQAHDWALDGIKFAAANGLLIVDENGTVRPTEGAARWELATLLQKLSVIPHTVLAEASLTDRMAESTADAAMLEDVRQTLYDGLLALDEKIDISAYNLTPDELKAVFQITAKVAEFFYIENSYSYTTYKNVVQNVIPGYAMTPKEIYAARSVYDKKMGEILAGVDAAWSDFEKALYVNDYLASHFQYDTTLQITDAYTFLTEGRGVCQGYTMVFGAAMTALGIPNTVANSERMVHTWNLVQIDGKWYHIDVTWNDLVPDQLGLVQHDYFLKSDAYMRAHEHEDWVIYENISCTDTKYDNAAFNDINTPFVPYEGLWYYIDNETGSISAWNYKNDTRTAVYTPALRWSAEGNRYYTTPYSGLALFKDSLIFNSEYEIMAYDLASGTVASLHKQTDGKQIWGFVLKTSDDNISLDYALANAPMSDTPVIKTLQFGTVATYTLSGTVSGYFAAAQVKLTLSRDGVAVQTLTLTEHDAYNETAIAFAFEELKAGTYTLTAEQSGAFTYTVEDIQVTADTDLSETYGVIAMTMGDISGNGIIDDADTALLLHKTTFHHTAATAATPEADLSGDGIIDIVDYAILTSASRFGAKKENAAKQSA